MRKRMVHDLAVWVGVMAACTGLCMLLSRTHDDNNPFATSLYILAVAIVSRYTSGYLFGITASIVGVVCVNYLFTYPFYVLDISMTGYPLTFAAMLIVSVLISALSTQLKRQERLRFEAENEKMRANLLRSLAHDIRTPLTAIIGASSALLDDGDLPGADREELLRGIAADARWLIRTTENLLSITKFSDDGVKLAKTEEVAEEIIGSAIVKFRKNTPNLSITVSKPDEILLVPMDAMLIEQVLLNLLENVALHAQGATSVSIAVAREGTSVVFSVSDNGAGIPLSVMPHVFDGQLAVGNRPRVDDRRSMGIGLSVCRAIIRAHGGDMRAFNKESGGATISFSLPEGEEDCGE